ICDDTVTTRSPTLGSSRLVSAKWPRWLVPIWLSKPSTVCAYGTAMMPALLISKSTPSTPSAKARTDARSCRSSLRTSTSPVMVAAALSALCVLRTAKFVWAPTRASSRAVTSPRPLLAPVMITVRPENEGRSAAVQSVMTLTLTRRNWGHSPSQAAGTPTRWRGGFQQDYLCRNTVSRSSGRYVRHLDVEACDDRLDVGRLLDGLLRVARHRELNEVALIRRRRTRRYDDAVVAAHAAAVEVVAALDHR